MSNETKETGIYRLQAIIDSTEHKINQLDTELKRLQRHKYDLQNLIKYLETLDEKKKGDK